jgi:hypothetical protein
MFVIRLRTGVITPVWAANLLCHQGHWSSVDAVARRHADADAVDSPEREQWTLKRGLSTPDRLRPNP